MMVGWYIGILGLLISFFAGINFIKSLKNLEGDLKVSILYLVIASAIYVLFSLLMISFGFLNYGIKNLGWQIVPILFSISSVFFIIGTKKLVSTLNKLGEKENN